jgi:hypothetical protein
VTVPHFSEAKLHYRTVDSIECLKKAERQGWRSVFCVIIYYVTMHSLV